MSHTIGNRREHQPGFLTPQHVSRTGTINRSDDATHPQGTEIKAIPLKPYKASECDLLDAISECVLQDREAVENLTRSLRDHWFLRTGEARAETLRWYTVLVLTHFVDGEEQPFDAATVKSILRNTRLEDLEHLRQLRNPGECSLRELYLGRRRRPRAPAWPGFATTSGKAELNLNRSYRKDGRHRRKAFRSGVNSGKGLALAGDCEAIP